MTYQEMCAFDVLYAAYLEARSGKRKKVSTAQYEANALACTEKLSRILASKTYIPGKFETFYVYEPKKRLVQAPAFVDKVVLHAVTDNILYEAVTKSFIRDNYASQKGKGTHDGLMRLKQFMVDYYRQYGTAEGWVLKCDVHHFFASIDHDKLKVKLKALLDRRGVDPQIYELLCIYIDTTAGLPLGYQTSQLLALLFLDEFDHIVKEKYGVKKYGRYMDDFLAIHPSKEFLKNLLADFRVFMGSYGLELNEKTGIFPLRNGIDFLGFHSYLTETGGVVQKLRKDGIDRIKKNIKIWRVEYPAGNITKEKILEKFGSWDAHAAHGDTYALRRKYADQVEEIIGEKIEIHRKINSTREARIRRRARQYRNIQKKRGEVVNPAMVLRTKPTPDDVPPWM
ncbi:reverse transcriptase domain-containing protein [Oscillospiraceae bacterium 50-16]